MSIVLALEVPVMFAMLFIWLYLLSRILNEVLRVLHDIDDRLPARKDHGWYAGVTSAAAGQHAGAGIDYDRLDRAIARAVG